MEFPTLINWTSKFQFLGVLSCRAVTAYSKVVRRMKRSSAEGTRGGGEHEIIPPLVRGAWGASPEKNFEF